MDLSDLASELQTLLRLRALPFGMKMFECAEDMEAIPRIRRPEQVHTLDQLVAQSARLGWTVGVTADNLVGAQCRAVVGLGMMAFRVHQKDQPIPFGPFIAAAGWITMIWGDQIVHSYLRMSGLA